MKIKRPVAIVLLFSLNLLSGLSLVGYERFPLLSYLDLYLVVVLSNISKIDGYEQAWV